MNKSVEFFFDFGSPTAYLAYTQLPAICAVAGAELVYRPMLLGAVFKATGNVSPVSVPAKGGYMLADMERFARRYRVPLVFNPHFPINTLTMMRAAVAIQLHEPQRFAAYVASMFNAMWVEGHDLGATQGFADALVAAGFAPESVLELAQRADIKETLKENTDEAVRRGAFGAPTMFVGNEMFFGQDRVDFVRDALSA